MIEAAKLVAKKSITIWGSELVRIDEGVKERYRKIKYDFMRYHGIPRGLYLLEHCKQPRCVRWSNVI